MPVFTTNKHDEIYYRDAGSGQPLFFIHGLGANAAMFAPQEERFSKSYRVLCPDLRGNGKSAKLSGPVKTILDRQCDDIAVLMESLEIEKAVFFGVSYGGVFCFHFALRYPEKVSGLVIIDSFSDTQPRTLVDWINMVALYLNLWMFFLPKKMFAALMASAYKKWPLAQQHIYQAGLDLRSFETVIQRLAINQANHTPQLSEITQPTLGIVGGDVKLLIEAMERAMGEIPQADLRIIPNAMDPSSLCQPEIVNDHLEKFLARFCA